VVRQELSEDLPCIFEGNRGGKAKEKIIENHEGLPAVDYIRQ